MKKGYCRKCERYDWIEDHHILPQSDFGEGETIELCPNCHTDYHVKLGRKNLKGQSIEYHYEHFYKWLAGLIIVIIGLMFILIF